MNTFTGKALMMATLLFIGLLGLWFLKESLLLFMPFIIAYYIAKLMNPLKKTLASRLRFPDTLATLLVMVLILGIVTLGITSLVYLLVQQFSNFAEDLPAIGQELYASVGTLNEAADSFLNISPTYVVDFFNRLIEFTINALSDFSMGFGQGLLNIVTFIPSLVFYLLILLIAIYYLSKDFDTLQEMASAKLKKLALVEKIHKTFADDIIFALIAYIKAQGILMVITFVILTLGLFVMGFRYVLLIALGIALLDALPVFGTGTVFGPWILIEVINGDYQTALFLGVIYGIATVTRQTLQPKILSTQIGISPLLTLIAIYLGIHFLGVLGIILGPLFMILSISFYKAVKTRTFID